MSDSDRMPGLIGSKRAASPTNAAAESPMQRQRLSSSSAAAATSPASLRSPLSAAQRCADDALTLIFGFAELRELLCATRTCRVWLAAAAKEKPRGLMRMFCEGVGRPLAVLFASSSPFRRHISHIVSYLSSFSLEYLAELRQLSELTALDVRLSAKELSPLVDIDGGGALAKLKATFPPKLRELNLTLNDMRSRSAAVWQLLLDALPAMEGLQNLTLTSEHEDLIADPESLSLESLLQLPRLSYLGWCVCDLTVSQLQTIKQTATLRSFIRGEEYYTWTVEHLAAFCRPPHRLQKLETFELWETFVDEAAMAELVCLPTLTALEPHFLEPAAYAFLPRFSRLQRLRVRLDSGESAAQQAERNALLVSALSACPVLTDLTLIRGDCTESFAGQLLAAVPRLRTLRLQCCALPSLRFLRHAPKLEVISIFDCRDVRPGHVISIGAFVPQLQSLRLVGCSGLQLDEVERQSLTPPGALGLPHLREFKYCKPFSSKRA